MWKCGPSNRLLPIKERWLCLLAMYLYLWVQTLFLLKDNNLIYLIIFWETVFEILIFSTFSKDQNDSFLISVHWPGNFLGWTPRWTHSRTEIPTCRIGVHIYYPKAHCCFWLSHNDSFYMWHIWFMG